MSLHVIVGAGSIGSAAARLLADDGERVRIISRRGLGPEHPAIERVAADATDAARIRELARGAAAIYNCANPRYHRWQTDWPPIADSLLAAAEHTGAVLAITSNLYTYGPVNAPMTEDMPLATTSRKGRVRAAMWQNAVAAHRAGRVRATEARGSDYIGPGADSMFGTQVAPAVLAGRTARVPAPLDIPHSYTYTLDMARTLVTIARDERAWGQPWHVPSPPPLTIREMAGELSRVAAVPAPRLRRVPKWLVRTVGAFVPVIGEFGEVSYQFERPFVLDSSRAKETFGLLPTDLDVVLADMARH